MRLAKKAKSALIGGLLISSAFLGLAFAFPTSAQTTTASNKLVIGVVADPVATFAQNPSVSVFIGQSDTDIPYMPLNWLSITGKVLPQIANPPAVVPGTNATQWIVNLPSPNMRWSDGVPINSTDLAYSLGIYMPTGPYANLSTTDVWGAVSGTINTITIMNSTAIRLGLAGPTPHLDLFIWLYSVYPWHYFKQFTGNNAVGTASILSGPGDSPYVPSGYTAGSRTMNLVPNPYSPAWNGKTPPLSGIIVNLFADETSLVNALAAGTVDTATISPSDVAALKSSSALKIVSVPSVNAMYFYIRTQAAPWNSTSFRQAIMYLVDKQKINSQLYNGTGVLGNAAMLAPQALAQFWPGGTTPTYNFSATTATNLLKAAGLVQGTNGHWTFANGTAFSMTLTTVSNDPNFIRGAQIIQQSLQSVGLDVTVQTQDINTATNNVYGSLPPAHLFDLMLYPNFYAPSPYRYLRNHLVYPTLDNSTFLDLRTTAVHDLDPTRAYGEVKQALGLLDTLAVETSVVFIPVDVAFNNVKFTNWEPALENVPLGDAVHVNPSYDTTVLASVAPVTATVVGAAFDYTPFIYGLVAVIVIIIVAAYALRRRGKQSPPKQSPPPASQPAQ